MDDTTDDDGRADAKRGEAVLLRALQMARAGDVSIPFEIILLLTCLHDRTYRLDLNNAIVAAYLLGKCHGDLEALARPPGSC